VPTLPTKAPSPPPTYDPNIKFSCWAETNDYREYTDATSGQTFASPACNMCPSAFSTCCNNYLAEVTRFWRNGKNNWRPVTEPYLGPGGGPVVEDMCNRCVRDIADADETCDFNLYTDAPTSVPTVPPTASSCDQNNGGCDLSSTTCEQSSLPLEHVCACLPGTIVRDYASHARHALHTMPCTPCLARHALHTMPCTPCLARHAFSRHALHAMYRLRLVPSHHASPPSCITPHCAGFTRNTDTSCIATPSPTAAPTASPTKQLGCQCGTYNACANWHHCAAGSHHCWVSRDGKLEATCLEQSTDADDYICVCPKGYDTLVPHIGHGHEQRHSCGMPSVRGWTV
jgi:hypothetical protein